MPKLVQVSAGLTKDRVATLKKENPEAYGKLPSDGIDKVEVTYDFGATPAEAGQYFTDDVIMRLLAFAISHPIQSKIRDGLATRVGKGMAIPQAVAEIQKEVYDVPGKKHVWKPGVSGPRKSAVEKLAATLKKKSPEAQAAEIKALQELLASMTG